MGVHQPIGFLQVGATARIGRVARLAAMVAISQFANLAAAADWPAWRGPTGIGWTDETDLPLSWDGKTGDNVLWKAPLAGTTGHSSPIVWGDRVFLTTSDKQTREQEASKEIPQHHIECYQAADGKLLWRTLIPPGQEVAGYSIYASPTPATDGKAVYAWFGSAVVAAVDFDGKLLWRHERKGPFVLNPGISLESDAVPGHRGPAVRPGSQSRLPAGPGQEHR